MKSRFLSPLFAILFCIVQTSSLSAKSEIKTNIEEMLNRLEKGRIYPFDSAYIKYNIKSTGEGITTTGIEEHYFDGIKHSIWRTTNTSLQFDDFSTTEESREVSIDDGTYLYSIDLDKKTCFRSKSSNASILEMVREMTPKQKKNYVKGFLQIEKSVTQEGGGGAEFKKTKTYLGKPCRVFDIVGTSTYLWENIVLKTASDDYEMAATEIKINVPVPQEKFKVPEGIRMFDTSDKIEE
ncbi:MAG: hypothetical protein P9M03_01615 [Candidatus Theseobacter exili]|nr:hypothetical protein [Candidatus Theseobacter exili]